MATPEEKWERAARLYLMASDAYGRGDPELAEMLVARGNQYADEVAQAAQQQQDPQQGEAVLNSRSDQDKCFGRRQDILANTALGPGTSDPF
jgi:hypothetical protein